jgi:hypothetical protein
LGRDPTGAPYIDIFWRRGGSGHTHKIEGGSTRTHILFFLFFFVKSAYTAYPPTPTVQHSVSLCLNKIRHEHASVRPNVPVRQHGGRKMETSDGRRIHQPGRNVAEPPVQRPAFTAHPLLPLLQLPVAHHADHLPPEAGRLGRPHCADVEDTIAVMHFNPGIELVRTLHPGPPELQCHHVLT